MEKVIVITTMSAVLFISGYTINMLSGSHEVIQTVVTQMVQR